MSQITTHVLDTAQGTPAAGIEIRLENLTSDHKWAEMAKGFTNADGRISDLLDNDVRLEPGQYRMVFEVGSYFSAQQVKYFYPYVSVSFILDSTDHYHIPLLISPFGYSTYRGS